MATNETKKKVNYDLPKGWDGSEEIVIEPTPFEAVGKLARIRSDDFAKKIKSAFRTTFHDLVGVNVSAVNNNILTDFYFEDNTAELPKGKIKSMVNINTNNNHTTNLFDLQTIVNNKFTGKVYKLNNATRLLLSKFVYGGPNRSKPNNLNRWENESSNECIVTQVKMPAPMGGERIILKVSNLDTNKIAQAIYGNKMVTNTIKDREDGSELNVVSDAMYNVRYAGLVKYDNTGLFNIIIEQFDPEAVKELTAKEDPTFFNSMTGGIRFY